MVTTFWNRAAKMALAGGPTVDKAELASWVARNLAEFALLIEVAGGPIEILDAAVRHARLDLASRRFTERLRGIRSRLGNVPDFYPVGVLQEKRSALLTSSERAACEILLNFAETLRGELDSGAPTSSAMGGRGQAAVETRTAWRGFSLKEKGTRYIELDIPSELIWRAWLTHPDGYAVRVVNDERLTASAFDIWWGVHDGTHLDHLASFTTAGPAPIEYGAGLLVAEALTMSMELLAGAESAGDLNIEAQVRNGILERLGRLPSIFSDPMLGRRAEAMGAEPETEFADLPTLARAYVLGPLLLLGRNGRTPLIPEDTRSNLRRRWMSARRTNPPVEALLSAAAGLSTMAPRWNLIR